MCSLQFFHLSSRPARVRAVIRVVPAAVGVGAFALALSLSSSGAQAAPRPSPIPPVIATPVPTPDNTGAAPSHSSSGPFGFLNPGNWLPDPKQWAADVFSQVLVTFLQSIAS